MSEWITTVWRPWFETFKVWRTSDWVCDVGSRCEIMIGDLSKVRTEDYV